MSDTDDAIKTFTATGFGCLVWLAIPAAILGIIGLFKIVF